MTTTDRQVHCTDYLHAHAHVLVQDELSIGYSNVYSVVHYMYTYLVSILSEASPLVGMAGGVAEGRSSVRVRRSHSTLHMAGTVHIINVLDQLHDDTCKCIFYTTRYTRVERAYSFSSEKFAL